MGPHVWKIEWDNETISIEKSGSLRAERAGAGLVQSPAGSTPSLGAPTTLPMRQHGMLALMMTKEWQPLPTDPSSNIGVSSGTGSVGSEPVPDSAPPELSGLPPSSLPQSSSVPMSGVTPSTSNVLTTECDDGDGLGDLQPFEDLGGDTSNDDLLFEDEVPALMDADAQMLRNLIGDTATVGGVTWTVIPASQESDVPEMVARFPSPGLVDGLPVRDQDVDLLRLWLAMYPGDIEEDVARLNYHGIRKKATWKLVTPREWVTFCGLIIAATRFHQKG